MRCTRGAHEGHTRGLGQHFACHALLREDPRFGRRLLLLFLGIELTEHLLHSVLHLVVTRIDGLLHRLLQPF